MAQESSRSTRTPFVSRRSVRLKGRLIPGAEDRQQKIPGFDQDVFSRSKVLCIGAGGLISHIAPALARKGVGAITLLDDDEVEVSNLNRQRFYECDVGKNKAIGLARNLQRECIHSTVIAGHALRFQSAVEAGIDLSCDVAVCGVDNNPTRVAASQYFRQKRTPVIFTAVSADADHGYVFVQEPEGPCLGCVFPDAADSKTYPCPGTPAVADVLQLVGAITIYAMDTCLVKRPRNWNYRATYLSDGCWDTCLPLRKRPNCPFCAGQVATTSPAATGP